MSAMFLIRGGERGGGVDTQLDELARAGEAFAAGDFEGGYRLAQEGLHTRPHDPALLAVAGRSALELGLEDAVAYLNGLVELSPDDAAAWRDLGLALLNTADLTGAERALRTAVRLDPDDPGTRMNLGHLAYLDGALEEATFQLWRTAELAPKDGQALRSLIEMNRLEGRTQAALEAARELTLRRPMDVLAALDVAELHLLLGNADESLKAFRRLLGIDTELGHAAYLYHGMIEVEIRRERWRAALDLTISASALDRRQLTTDLLSYVSAQLFGPGARPTPDRAGLERRLAERRSAHRRLHADSLLLERPST
jgi:Flp pilus assembly protein TadD